MNFTLSSIRFISWTGWSEIDICGYTMTYIRSLSIFKLIYSLVMLWRYTYWKLLQQEGGIEVNEHYCILVFKNLYLFLQIFKEVYFEHRLSIAVEFAEGHFLRQWNKKKISLLIIAVKLSTFHIYLIASFAFIVCQKRDIRRTIRIEE